MSRVWEIIKHDSVNALLTGGISAVGYRLLLSTPETQASGAYITILGMDVNPMLGIAGINFVANLTGNVIEDMLIQYNVLPTTLYEFSRTAVQPALNGLATYGLLRYSEGEIPFMNPFLLGFASNFASNFISDSFLKTQP